MANAMNQDFARNDPAFAENLARVAARVEARLEAALGDAAQAGEIARPERLMAAMRHGVLGGGKRVRAFLVVEGAAMLGAAPDGALEAAAAIECLHAYSLVHDDLPAMDDDDMRRGRPTVHRAFDDATAILAGDALLTLAFELLSAEATHRDPGIRAALVLDLARSAGLGGMVGGQMLDLAAEGRFDGGGARALAADAIRALQAMKTGALIGWSCRAGAHLAGDVAALAALARYGRAVGLAFQLADDLIDLEGDAASAGKATGKDAAAGKATLPGLNGVAWTRSELARLVTEADTALAPFGARAASLRAMARFIADRSA